MINIKDILNSWITSFNPSEEELSRANDRYDVCSTCPARKELLDGKKWTIICGACGCPLQKKIYSNVINPCPLKKWEDVDKKHNLNTSIKKTNTLF